MLARHSELRQLKVWNGHLHPAEAQLITRLLVAGMDGPGFCEARERQLVLSNPSALRRPFNVMEIMNELMRMPSEHIAFVQVFETDGAPLAGVREGVMVQYPSLNFGAHLSVCKGGGDEYALVEAGYFNLRGKTTLRVTIMTGGELMRVLDEYSRSGETTSNRIVNPAKAEMLWDVQPMPSTQSAATPCPVQSTVRHPAAVFTDEVLAKNGWSDVHIRALRAGLLG